MDGLLYKYDTELDFKLDIDEEYEEAKTNNNKWFRNIARRALGRSSCEWYRD